MPRVYFYGDSSFVLWGSLRDVMQARFAKIARKSTWSAHGLRWRYD